MIISVLLFIKKCLVQGIVVKYLIAINLCLNVMLQSELIIRAILWSPQLKKIKVGIESKLYFRGNK